MLLDRRLLTLSGHLEALAYYSSVKERQTAIQQSAPYVVRL